MARIPPSVVSGDTISDNKNLHKIVIALRFIANTRIIRSGNDEMQREFFKNFLYLIFYIMHKIT